MERREGEVHNADQGEEETVTRVSFTLGTKATSASIELHELCSLSGTNVCYVALVPCGYSVT